MTKNEPVYIVARLEKLKMLSGMICDVGESDHTTEALLSSSFISPKTLELAFCTVVAAYDRICLETDWLMKIRPIVSDKKRKDGCMLDDEAEEDVEEEEDAIRTDRETAVLSATLNRTLIAVWNDIFVALCCNSDPLICTVGSPVNESMGFGIQRGKVITSSL